MILAKIIVWFLVVGYMVFDDIVKHKEPFDKAKKVFSFKLDYWRFRWDNLGRAFLLSALGGIISSEVGGYIIIQTLKAYTPDTTVTIVDGAFELTAVAACSFFIPRRLLKEKG